MGPPLQNLFCIFQKPLANFRSRCGYNQIKPVPNKPPAYIQMDVVNHSLFKENITHLVLPGVTNF